MEISDIISIALPAVFVLVGVALVWMILEVVSTLRKTRSTIKNVEEQIEPTLQSVQRITAQLEPVVSKVDPLVERVSLTVDAANLEIMRVDKILEDVTEITDTVSSAVEAVDEVASAPLDLVTSLTGKIRGAFKPTRASTQSIGLGEKKRESQGQHPGVVVQKAAPSEKVAPRQAESSNPTPETVPSAKEEPAAKAPMSDEDRISQILEAAQESMEKEGSSEPLPTPSTQPNSTGSYFTYAPDQTTAENK